MKKVCGDFLVLTPYKWVKDGCVYFDKDIRAITNEFSSGKREKETIIITHGLASTHTHLGLYPVRSSVAYGLNLDSWVKGYAWPWEKFLIENPELSYHVAVLAIRDMLSSGVTAFADMHFNEEKVAEAVVDVGIKGDLSVAIMDGGVFSSFEEALESNRRLIKAVEAYEKVSARFGPCTPRLLTPDQFKLVVEEARELGVGIHTHIAEVVDDEVWLKNKWRMRLPEFLDYVELSSVDTIVAHAIWIHSSIEKFVNDRLWVSHPPRSNTFLGDGKAPITELLALGGNVSLGIDVAPTYSLRDDMTAFLTLHYGGGRNLGVDVAFSLATEGGYRALGLGTGDIVVGEPADLVVWKVKNSIVHDPVSEIVVGNPTVSQVFVDGELVFEDGKLSWLGIDKLAESESALTEYLRIFKNLG